MFVTIIPKIGGAPVTIEASQIVVLNDAGTPVSISGLYGPDRAIRTAHVLDRDFNQVLAAFGHGRHVVHVDKLELPPPPHGARVIAGPDL